MYLHSYASKFLYLSPILPLPADNPLNDLHIYDSIRVVAVYLVCFGVFLDSVILSCEFVVILMFIVLMFFFFLNKFLYFLFLFKILFIFNFLNCCSSTVVSIFTPTHPTTPPIPASHPQTYPGWLCQCVLYSCSLMTFPLHSSFTPLLPPLCLLSACSLFQSLWLYFVNMFVVLIRFHL